MRDLLDHGVGKPLKSTFVALVTAAFMGGCATSSVLVHPDDPTFAQAQQRMDRAITVVEEINPPPAERTLFLQAESFYRYRFEPPARSIKSFLAEAGAAIMDFPALQSLAGSFDLLDLRLRASDSAIQLWETLLVRYPHTTLRPLTLYRLGWAYRNASIGGLPRRSPDEAFDELIKTEPTSQFALLAQDAKTVSWKSKAKATTRSLIPGLGQLYVDEPRNGMTRLGVAVAAVVAIIGPIYIAAHRGTDLTWSRDWPLLATGVGGLVVLSFDYTSSYEDAMRGVVQWNERAESAFNRAHPEAP